MRPEARRSALRVRSRRAEEIMVVRAESWCEGVEGDCRRVGPWARRVDIRAALEAVEAETGGISKGESERGWGPDFGLGFV